jgi:hypothetical protein
LQLKNIKQVKFEVDNVYFWIFIVLFSGLLRRCAPRNDREKALPYSLHDREGFILIAACCINLQ